MRHIIISLLLLISTNSYSQDFNGVYLSARKDTIIIRNDSLVRFNFYYGCCILSNYYGAGTLKEFKDYQIVTTEESDFYGSSYFEEKHKLSDSTKIEIIVKNNKGEPIPGANIVAIDNKNRPSYGSIGNEDYISIDIKENTKLFKISTFGYSSLELPIELIKGKKIECILQEGNELIDLNLKISCSADSLVLESLVDKDYKNRKLKKIGNGIYFFISHWPWKWKYKGFHDPKSITFLKK